MPKPRKIIEMLIDAHQQDPNRPLSDIKEEWIEQIQSVNQGMISRMIITKKEDAYAKLHKLALYDPKDRWGATKSTYISLGGTAQEADDTKETAKTFKQSINATKKSLIREYTSQRHQEQQRRLHTKFPYYKKEIDEELIWARNKALERQDTTVYSFSQSHTSLVHELSPHQNWVLLIDESGSNFDQDKSAKDKVESRFVGVLVPANHSLAELSLHATDETLAKKAQAFSTITRDNKVAIFGA